MQVTIREITCTKIKLIWSRIYTWSIIFNNSMTYFALNLEKEINHMSLTILAQIFQYYWLIFFNGKLWLNRWIFKTLTSNQATYFQVFNLVSSLVNDRWWLDEWCLLVLLWCVLRSCHVVDCTKEFILGLFCTPMLVFVTKDSSIPLFFQANLYWVNLNLKS